MTGYTICTRCIMDTSDPDIVFTDDGVCSHCKTFDRVMASVVTDPVQLAKDLERRVDEITKAGRGKPYDCIVGISGGVDSTYVALRVKQLGLRPLAVHLDNGWDTEIAVGNIERALRRLNIDLISVVLEWEEFRDLQVAFLKSSTPDSEIPTDHAIVASVYQTAWRMKIPYLVMGYNRATELVLPPSWSQGHFDWRYIRKINERFGRRPLRTFPHLTFPDYVRFRYWAEKRALNVLEYQDYSRDGAIADLQRELGWRDYGGKHHESIYTRFFQGHILPRKFGFDKRRAHLSNKILSGQVTRDAALEAMKAPHYASSTLEEHDREYVVKKLEMTEPEFEAIMQTPPKRYEDYPNMLNSAGYLGARRAYRAARGGLSFVRTGSR